MRHRAQGRQEPAGWPLVSTDPKIQSLYESARQAGSGHRLAEMLAFRQGPAICGQSRVAVRLQEVPFSPTPAGRIVEGFYRSAAAKAGVDVSGKVLIHQLERFPGDPEAWVSSATPLDDIKDICRRRGWGVQGGGLNIPPRDEPPKQEGGPYRPARDIVDDEIRKEHGEQVFGAATPAEIDQLREQVGKRLAGSYGES